MTRWLITRWGGGWGAHSEGDGIEDGRLDAVYERLDELDVNLVEKRAGEILNGLGFTLQTINKKARDFSGGWRMRISLARALFVSPQLLLLDEPTNHLDMESCIWLESTLGQYKRTLVIISHSQVSTAHKPRSNQQR